MSLIGKSIGNYRVIAKIGEGGMGSVYLGEHPMIGKRVAIKTLHPDLATKEDIVSRFFTEAKAVNDIAHPNIVDIVDFGKMRDDELNADVVYFVMEFLDGEGLNSRLKRDGVSPREAVHILRQCGSALAASHRKHIVHRDLKPENIYLVTRGEDKNYCKLLDFGIAKLTGSESSISQHKTRTGLVIGTPAYMSPEQCEGKGNVDSRSDMYSLGVCFYEMLTGRVPFPGDGFGEVLVAHLTKTPELPSTVRQDVPAGLEAIVMHMMEKDKNRRFQTMEEFLAAIDDPGAHLQAWGSPSGRSDASAAGTMMMQSPAPGTGAMPIVQGPRASTGEGPRPTTLSGASGEVAGEGSKGKSKAPLFAVVGLVVAAAVGGGIFMKQKSASDDAARSAEKAHAEEATAAAQAKAQAPVHIEFDSTPRGAKVFRAGVTEAIGTTPFPLTVKRSEPEFDVQVKLEGYKDGTASVAPGSIAPDQTKEVRISLDKNLAAPTPVVATPTPQPVPVVATPTSKPPEHHHSSTPAKKKGGGDKDDVLAPSF